MARPPEHRPHPLDRLSARIVALAVFAAMAGLLGYIHRDDLFARPGIAQAPASTAEQAFAACVAERHAEVDRMLAEGLIDAARTTLFKGRAEALCHDLAPPR